MDRSAQKPASVSPVAVACHGPRSVPGCKGAMNKLPLRGGSRINNFEGMNSLSLTPCSSFKKTKHSFNKPTYARSNTPHEKYFHFLQNTEMSPREVRVELLEVSWVFLPLGLKNHSLPFFSCLVFSRNENTGLRARHVKRGSGPASTLPLRFLRLQV